MSFLFTCPHCGARTQIPESFVGQTGPCHMCGKAVQIDAPQKANQSSNAEPATRASVGVMIALTLGVLCTLIAGVGVTLVLAIPKLQSTANVRKMTVSTANLKLIVTGLHAYHDEYGRFPPPYSRNAEGKKMHSWRVLVLPYLGAEARAYHERFKLDEPWDSKHNLDVASSMPDVYRSPSDLATVGSNVANYYVVVGSQTLFPDSEEGATMNNNLDPLNHTILVVESVARSNIWTEPVELHVSKMTFELNTFSGDDLSGPIAGGVLVGLADGSTFLIEEDTPAEMVEGMTTPSGNDQVPPEL